ncbi:hypothetical protein D030_0977A, partial [Vibrio parahaemolyticus AQ3810]
MSSLRSRKGGKSS